jgi:predicted RecB family nuclease
MLKELPTEKITKLGDRGIVTLNQLIRLRADEVAEILGASIEEAERVREIAEKTLSSPH